MIEPNLTSIEISIRDKYNAMSTAHIGLCIDIIALIKESTIRGRTYVDALRLAEVTARSLNSLEKR